MGKIIAAGGSPVGPELAPGVLLGSFTGTGNDGAFISFLGPFNFAAWGGSGTIGLEASFDGGTTWIGVPANDSGTVISVATGTANALFRVNEPEPGVMYRARCSAFTSGTVNYRISGGSRLT